MEKKLIDVTTIREESVGDRYKQYRDLGYCPEFTIKELENGTWGISRVVYEVKVYKLVDAEEEPEKLMKIS